VFDLHRPLYDLGVIYLIILLFRAVLSWFPPGSSSWLPKVNHWLYVFTEPLLAPLRKVIPPVGMLDVSYMVVFFGVYLFTAFVLHRVVV
jgi:YggT family protein